MSSTVGVVGTRSGEILIIDDRVSHNKPVVAVKQVHSKKISDIDIDINGTTIASSSNDKFAFIFDVKKNLKKK